MEGETQGANGGEEEEETGTSIIILIDQRMRSFVLSVCAGACGAHSRPAVCCIGGMSQTLVK